MEKYTTIQVRKEDAKKLNSYKEYGSEPYWIIIKKILEGKIKIEVIK